MRRLVVGAGAVSQYSSWPRRRRPGRGRSAETCSVRTRSAPTRTRRASTAVSTSPERPGSPFAPRRREPCRSPASSRPRAGRVTIQLDGYAVSLTHLGEIAVAKGATVAEGDAARHRRAQAASRSGRRPTSISASGSRRPPTAMSTRPRSCRRARSFRLRLRRRRGAGSRAVARPAPRRLREAGSRRGDVPTAGTAPFRPAPLRPPGHAARRCRDSVAPAPRHAELPAARHAPARRRARPQRRHAQRDAGATALPRGAADARSAGGDGRHERRRGTRRAGWLPAPGGPAPRRRRAVLPARASPSRSCAGLAEAARADGRAAGAASARPPATRGSPSPGPRRRRVAARVRRGRRAASIARCAGRRLVPRSERRGRPAPCSPRAGEHAAGSPTATERVQLR